MGELNWSKSVNAVAAVAGEANHPGILRNSTAANTNVSALRMINNNNIGTITRGDVDSMTAIVRPRTMTAVKLMFGLIDNASGSDTSASDMIAFVFSTGVDNDDWSYITKSGGTGTTTATTTDIAADTWYKLEIRGISTGSIDFYINDVAVATGITSNIPSSSIAFTPVLSIQSTNSTTNTNFDIDYFRIRSIRYGARF